MANYTIGELAERSGFSASTLRYYDGIGLVEPATRTEAGYRLYDDHTLAQLGFIARAKQLGCSLEEINDLVNIWDGERCGPVQRRFHQLVTEKTRAVQRQLTDLSAFAGQLQVAAEQLSGEPVDGPCGDSCACVTTSPAAAVELSPVAPMTKPVDIPIACTLQPDAIDERVVSWKAVLAHVDTRIALADGGLRMEFGDSIDLSQVAHLVVFEQQCCAFFSFAITVDHRGVALEVRAPDDASGVLAAMFGDAA